MSNPAKGAKCRPKPVFLSVWSFVCKSPEPLQMDDLKGRFGKGVHAHLRKLELQGRIKKRRTFGLGHPAEYTAADREWKPLPRTIEQDNREKRERDRLGRKLRSLRAGTKPKTSGDQKHARAEQMEQQGLVEYPFFSEKFAPYVEFFPPKIARKYERTLAIRKQRELAAANQQFRRGAAAEEQAS